jgi:hypothetical protein
VGYYIHVSNTCKLKLLQLTAYPFSLWREIYISKYHPTAAI